MQIFDLPVLMVWLLPSLWNDPKIGARFNWVPVKSGRC